MMCPVCNRTRWKYVFTTRDRMLGIPGKFDEYRCEKCGFVRIQPLLSAKELKKYYPSKKYYSYQGESKPGFFGRLRSYLIRHLNRPTLVSRFLELFISVPAMPHGAPGGKIMDIGCGSGDTLKLLSTVGWDAYGLDIDAVAIKIAHKRGLKNVRMGTYADLSTYPDNFFESIRMYHVIEHIDNPDRCLQLVYQKLKPGGEIIIGTPNISSVVAKLFRQYWYNLDAPRHLVIFSPGTLSVLLKRNLFRNVETTFSSAGGWVGSIQYVYNELTGRNHDFVNRPVLIIIMYPIEWILDKIGLGDVFVMRAMK